MQPLASAQTHATSTSSTPAWLALAFATSNLAASACGSHNRSFRQCLHAQVRKKKWNLHFKNSRGAFLSSGKPSAGKVHFRGFKQYLRLCLCMKRCRISSHRALGSPQAAREDFNSIVLSAMPTAAASAWQAVQGCPKPPVNSRALATYSSTSSTACLSSNRPGTKRRSGKFVLENV